MSSKKLQAEAQKLHNLVDVYKGTTISGDYGWIMRPAGRNEFFLGKNLKDAYETVHNLVIEKEEVAESYGF